MDRRGPHNLVFWFFFKILLATCVKEQLELNGEERRS